MKRRITIEQLNELTEEQKQKLREWWNPKRFDVSYDGETTSSIDFGDYNADETELPLLDIGQMIELLLIKKQKFELNETSFVFSNTSQCGGEIVDALWEAVKSILA